MRVILETSSDLVPQGRIALAAGQMLTIGRTEWADLAVPDPTMSSTHFSVTVTSNKCQLKDLGSMNGTFVNGLKVKSATLQDGDQITAGETAFKVVVEDGPEGTRARKGQSRGIGNCALRAGA